MEYTKVTPSHFSNRGNAANSIVSTVVGLSALPTKRERITDNVDLSTIYQRTAAIQLQSAVAAEKAPCKSAPVLHYS
jgi:hypothetical protein